MRSTRTIMERNNQTIAFFNDSDYLNAIEASALALSSLREASAVDPTESSPDEEGSRTSNTDGSSHSNAPSGSDRLDQCMLLPAAVQNDFKTLLHSTNFIYDNAIQIPPSLEVDTHILGAIVIFNAALAHHLASESQETPTPPEALHKAQRLYRLSYQLYGGGKSLLFQFAVLNNLGVVERRLGNTSISNQYFDYLASLVEQFENKQQHQEQG
ncbi:unnamed protein product [Cylindrotheca closterium]|uniref:Uncharacterized protein n=1 Tax=Cylindrotheca closterium TaxID=2856 RepID=A0AAD2GCM4_9STRA|nr:unnamed protein product [Cylindrotheca closterium]